MSIAHALEWGRYVVWSKDRWAVQVSFPYVRWNRHKRELFLDADVALRLSWGEPAFGFQVFGFGFGATLRPQGYRPLRNDGKCWHGVSLNRVCSECKEPTP